jgi:DNA-binding CsgD family transcriptional regulator
LDELAGPSDTRVHPADADHTAGRSLLLSFGGEGPLVGREEELEAIDLALDAGRTSLSVLVVEGEAGIGKTAVWREGVSRASAQGFQVLSCRAAPAETRLSFTGLGDLLSGLDPAAFDALPAPQRRALDVALLRTEAQGWAPDPRAIATGVVSLVSSLATDARVLLAVDDVQWLDGPTARALGFALRRLESRSVVVLLTRRLGEPAGRVDPLSGMSVERVRRCRLGPLSVGALHHILKDHLGQALTRPLLVRIARVSGGIPLYALEIARALAADGHPPAGAELPVPEDMRELLARRLRRLPRRTRDELVKASALTRPTVTLVDREQLGPAVDAAIVRVLPDGQIEFSHPLLATAVYAGASRERRKRLHGELAAAVADVEERARHLALANEGHLEHIAAALEEAAALAHRRGAPDAAAELAEQAAERTPPDAVGARLERCLQAAQHYYKAGDTERANAFAEQVRVGSPPGPLRASALHLLAEIGLLQSPPSAIPLLQEALACTGEAGPHAAQIEASLGFALLSVADTATAEAHLRRAVELAESSGQLGLLAEALGVWALCRQLSGHGLSDEELERALSLEDPDRDVSFQMRASLNVAQAWEFTGRIGKARELLLVIRERVLARGDEADLAFVLIHLSATALLAGELETAKAEAEEAVRVAGLAGQEVLAAFALVMRALATATRGDDGAAQDAADALAMCERIGWPWGVMEARWAQALLALGDGDAEAAALALAPIVDAVEASGIYDYPAAQALPDAIEALVATGERDRAARLTDALAGHGRAVDRPWALALAGRCTALVRAAAGDLEGALSAAEHALVEHERLPFPFELGRTLLVMGQIQRRRGERRAARETLERAIAVFEQIGAARWAANAREEMRRIGVRRAPAGLTESERRVAELAAEGLTNSEVAARLFVSRRTVEANLARVYRKLGIRSRAQLAIALIDLAER